jgi:hypothetical protein
MGRDIEHALEVFKRGATEDCMIAKVKRLATEDGGLSVYVDLEEDERYPDCA